jgi:amino acid permease
LLLVGVILAAPLSVLPCKDTIEEIWLGQNVRMSSNQNLLVTFLLVSTICVCAVAIPNIGDAMTIVGATSNPIVGFTLPIMFYLKIKEKKQLEAAAQGSSNS